ncbi:unnamed protein product [Ectocarpus sp. 13 AM-2016]
MPFRAVSLCKPCLNKKYPLRTQLLLSFLALAAVSLLLALTVVMGTTAFIGDKAKSEARDSLENQIKRHLTNASEESATAIREWFRNLQYGVLDVTAFALRDARQEDLILDGGNEGYPLNPAHTDLRDTEIASSAEANLQNFSRMSFEVDLSRSTWYYADAESNTVEVPEDEMATITQTARLDLLWPTVYINSYDTKGVYVGVELSTTGRTIRYFPGTDLSGVEGSSFACEYVEEDGSIAPCFDPTVRPWYQGAEDVAVDSGTSLGAAIISDPYKDAIDDEWLLSLARAVYSDSDSTRGNLLGVVGMDVRLEQVQKSVESIDFLNTGYSILVTADGIVLAAGVWDRDGTEEAPTVCALGNGICSGSDGDEWVDLLAEIENGGIKSFTSRSTAGVEAEEWILVAAPVEGNFATATSGGAGTVTHYILSAVPRNEIFEPVVGMAELIKDSTVQIIVTTAIVACFTLVAVALSVYFLAGSITRPIVEMTSAARSIAADGAKTDVFGSVTATWGARRDSARDSAGGCGTDISTPGRFTVNRTACLDYLLCRGDDEISTLGREFSLMITGLGRRGSAAEATGLMDKRAGYPKNPYAATIVKRPPPTGPSASGGAAVPGPKS